MPWQQPRHVVGHVHLPMDEQRPGAWQANVRFKIFLGDDIQAFSASW
jgi:hypothetical protein